MKNKNHHELANFELENFLNKSVLNYSKLRNYDYGPSNRGNTSNLSKYISHRILNEYQIVKKTLNQFKLNNVEKFIQEIFWRVYWKGWLENRQMVWNDFVYYEYKPKKNKFYLDAIEGNTKIECFNEWVEELKKYNYLHNHTRMWFASIWIFTLKLPWQLGAKFFLEHLFDGDAASNTLSWRWVAGLQTKGKHYLAKSWNIEKYTNGKFSSQNINEEEMPLEEEKDFQLTEHIQKKNFEKKSNFLLLFENSLSFNDKNFFESYKEVYVLLVGNKFRNISLSKNVLNFKLELIKDFQDSFPNAKFVYFENSTDLVLPSNTMDVIYPFVGENLDFLKKIPKTKFNYIYQNEDVFCWQYAKKGFFNFKKNISRIIDHLELH